MVLRKLLSALPVSGSGGHQLLSGGADSNAGFGAVGLKFWALQYVPVCQVLEPLWLRREISEALLAGWEKYRKMLEATSGRERG